MDVVEVEVTPAPAVIEVIVAGPQGPQGPPGATSYYRHVQSTPAAVWTIPHNLGYKPGGIYAEDSAHTQFIGRITHIDGNTLTIEPFVGGIPVATGGEAFLS